MKYLKPSIKERFTLNLMTINKPNQHLFQNLKLMEIYDTLFGKITKKKRTKREKITCFQCFAL